MARQVRSGSAHEDGAAAAVADGVHQVLRGADPLAGPHHAPLDRAIDDGAGTDEPSLLLFGARGAWVEWGWVEGRWVEGRRVECRREDGGGGGGGAHAYVQGVEATVPSCPRPLVAPSTLRSSAGTLSGVCQVAVCSNPLMTSCSV